MCVFSQCRRSVRQQGSENTLGLFLICSYALHVCDNPHLSRTQLKGPRETFMEFMSHFNTPRVSRWPLGRFLAVLVSGLRTTIWTGTKTRSFTTWMARWAATPTCTWWERTTSCSNTVTVWRCRSGTGVCAAAATLRWVEKQDLLVTDVMYCSKYNIVHGV